MSTRHARTPHEVLHFMVRLTVTNVHFTEDERSLILGFLRGRNYKRLLEMADSLDTAVVEGDVVKYIARSQFVALIKKYPFTKGESAIDPRANAIRTFMRSERRCRLANRAFLLRRRGVLPNPKQPTGLSRHHTFLLGDMKRVILSVLGESPDLARIYDQCDFTAGAAIGVHGNRTNLGRKILAKTYSVSPGCRPYAHAALWKHEHLREVILDGAENSRQSFDAILGNLCRTVQYNKVTFVPKTAKTERSIAVEPLLNGYLQKGVDLEMRRRLRKIGIDLSTQKRNQDLAYSGSIASSDPWCTIDLSSASDSMSRELVRYLLPADWFEFLDSIRSHQYSIQGVLRPYEKFVSMGNGFCFPLQTLIFSAACIASVARVSGTDPTGYLSPFGGTDFLAYGDDIIVRKSVFRTVTSLLRIMGFSLNRKKTFSEGPFRESCGADWMNGVAVRPVYLDELCSDTHQIIAFHNSLRAGDSSFLFTEDDLEGLRSMVPERFRFVTPFSDRNGAFHVPMDVFMASRHSKFKRSTQAWSWKEFLTRPIYDDGQGVSPERWRLAEYAAFLRGASPSRRGETLAVRRKTRVHERRVSSWGEEVTCLPLIPRSRPSRV
jgi:hypothetical protein